MLIVRVVLCIAAAVSASMALAAAESSRFDISAGGAVEFDVRDVSRRDVMERLFAGTGIALKWTNPAFADAPISGQWNGTRAAVVRQMLTGTNFVIEYDDKARLSRVIIVGPAATDAEPASLAAVTSAVQKNGPQADHGSQAIPIAAPAVQHEPAPAVPVASGAVVQHEPAPAIPVASGAVVQHEPAPAIPVATGTASQH
jgi:hypothetical protein